MSRATLRHGVALTAYPTGLLAEIAVGMPLAACPWRGAVGET
ncbi:MAG TPA: hypothetical protein VFG86_27940 [Chloroflexota bacterium]|nr:hypothetical protein [Chloroflexota bacterium]